MASVWCRASRLAINPIAHLGRHLTTEDQRSFCTLLIKFWEDAGKPGRPDAVFHPTQRSGPIAAKEGLGHERNSIAVTGSLRKLARDDSDRVGYPIHTLTKDHCRWQLWLTADRLNDSGRSADRGEAPVDGAVNASLGYFKFDDHILKNLLN